MEIHERKYQHRYQVERRAGGWVVIDIKQMTQVAAPIEGSGGFFKVEEDAHKHCDELIKQEREG